MKRWHLRYDKGGALMDYQQQKNHYAWVHKPRKTMNLSEDKHRKMTLSLNHHNKLEHETNRSRQHQNERLQKTLTIIIRDRGLLGSMEDRAQEIGKNKKKPTLLNEFREKQKQRELEKQNKQLRTKIGSMKPAIGNIITWDNQFEDFKKQEKKISRATQNVFRVPKDLQLSQRSLHSTSNQQSRNKRTEKKHRRKVGPKREAKEQLTFSTLAKQYEKPKQIIEKGEPVWPNSNEQQKGILYGKGEKVQMQDDDTKKGIQVQ